VTQAIISFRAIRACIAAHETDEGAKDNNNSWRCACADIGGVPPIRAGRTALHGLGAHAKWTAAISRRLAGEVEAFDRRAGFLGAAAGGHRKNSEC
jgi:hypothetical protein